MGHQKTIFNFDFFNRWLTLLTNIGVIAGFALVIYEVNQNTMALENGTDIAVWNIGSQTANLIVENPDIAQIYTRFRTEPWDNFTKEDQTRLNLILGSLIDRLELQLRLYERKGDVLYRDDIMFPEYLLKLETFKVWWKVTKQQNTSIPTDFKKFFDAYIKEVNNDK